jgi:uncharacterized protein YutE (UPF0331/DUF86 family)
VRNLKNDNYRKIIIGVRKNLAEVFAEIDIDSVREKLRSIICVMRKFLKKFKAS